MVNGVVVQAAGYWSQLEITLFTTNNSMSVVAAADAAVAALDQHSLKVNILCAVYSTHIL